MEGPFQNKIEAEIAELASQIEAKRKLLESEKGLVEEKEVLKSAVGEKMSQGVPSFSARQNTSSASSGTQSSSGSSYLDSVGSEVEAEVNSLLSVVFEKGIDEAIKRASSSSPLVLDAFHDALTDKLYEEMKNRGVFK